MTIFDHYHGLVHKDDKSHARATPTHTSQHCHRSCKCEQDLMRLWNLLQLGFAAAQKNLGVMFASGRGVEKDNVEVVLIWIE